MALTETTAPLIEPVTRDELKAHLRIDTTDDALVIGQSILPAEHVEVGAYGLEGDGVDVSGSSVTVVFDCGDATGSTVDVKIQESTDNNVFTDVTDGSFTTIAGVTNHESVQELAYTNGYQYIRAVAQIVDAAAAFGVSVIEQANTTDENDLLDGLIVAARLYCESFAGRSFIDTVWKLTVDDFPIEFTLPRPPLDSVVTIKYYDTDSAQQTLAAGNYDVDTQSEPGRVVEDPDATWPQTADIINAVEVNFKSGYGTLAADVPERYKLAIKMLASCWYENREAVSEVSMTEMPLSVKSLLWQERVKAF